MIKIKGVNGNLVFVFGPGTCAEYLTYLSSHLAQNNALFAGSSVYFKGDGLKNLSHQEIAALQKLCLENGLLLNNNEPEKIALKNETVREKTVPTPPAGQDVFLNRHIRSGQKVHADGSLVIWGDVNESAEITAGGDIIVLGKLAGIAHAGCFGREDSVVFALNLAPSQIRIADKISRSSGDKSKNFSPEIAYLDEKNICISKYSVRKGNMGAKK
ncbi:MAG TPA: septum site-determining protein MinC [Syntrophomonadaceae bacterium]|nr:septum site-determining protein MinC [Syntrophomonadaceae bacterium]HNX28375.1 septum site-determining protein MinC [Syntrophomonadaceae bacterium]HPR92693.1 septum site-determining protein MinC [Syntrophomonadaceae bacterium]